MTPEFHQYFMQKALREAEKAAAEGEVPTGCVIIPKPAEDEQPLLACVPILGRAHNQTEGLKDPTAHAEMLAITQATAAKGDFRLTDTILYVTKEPCAMCAGAIVLARIPLVVYGLTDPNRGGQSHFGILTSDTLIHRSEIITGVCEEECKAIIQNFFRERRRENRG